MHTTESDMAIFIILGSVLTKMRVPIGAAIIAATPKGITKVFSAFWIAIGNNWSKEGRPLRVAIATAECGPSVTLTAITIMSDAPNPTNPRTMPANNIPSPITRKFQKVKVSIIVIMVANISRDFRWVKEPIPVVLNTVSL